MGFFERSTRRKSRLAAALVGASLALAACSSNDDWRTASRESAGLAPLPSVEREAVVQVYAARAFRWRKYFAVHAWIATKERDAAAYRVYQVVGWNLGRGEGVVVDREDFPDRYWYGARPELIQTIRGAAAERAIPRIRELVAGYAYPETYRAWPGPNSNTFVAHIIRHVPELGVELPPHAVGKDWIGRGDFFGRSESGTGVQFSVYGVLGATLGLAEGVEVNLLGLSFGVDLWRPALKLPMIGRLGFPDAPVFEP